MAVKTKTTAKSKKLNKEWQEWLELNLRRGCAREDIISSLNGGGFDGEAVLKAALAANGGGRVNLHYVDYVGLSKVRITKLSAKDGVSKFDSDKIQLFSISDFLNEKECDKLIKVANISLKPSTVALISGDEYDPKFRTSSTSHLPQANKFVQSIEEKLLVSLALTWLFLNLRKHRNI